MAPAHHQASEVGCAMPRGKIIATRILEVADKPGARVTVNVHMPKPCKTGEWACAYSIRGPGWRTGMTIHGFDAVQALLGAMKIARVMLETSDEGKRGALRWEGSPDLGLPALPDPPPRPG